MCLGDCRHPGVFAWLLRRVACVHEGLCAPLVNNKRSAGVVFCDFKLVDEVPILFRYMMLQQDEAEKGNRSVISLIVEISEP